MSGNYRAVFGFKSEPFSNFLFALFCRCNNTIHRNIVSVCFRNVYEFMTGTNHMIF